MDNVTFPLSSNCATFCFGSRRITKKNELSWFRWIEIGRTERKLLVKIVSAALFLLKSQDNFEGELFSDLLDNFTEEGISTRRTLVLFQNLE